MHFVDILIIVASLAFAFGLGIYFSRKQKDATEFFVGSRSISWPMACFSLIATETSGITFLAIPAAAFHKDWTFLQMGFGFILGRILVALYLIPHIRKGNFTSVYEYIHTRMGPWAGAITALVFILTRVLADGVRLFVTALPLQFATGLPFAWAVGITLVATAFYSMLSGIRGIVWLDTIQLFVYLAGGALSIIVIAGQLPDGLVASLTQLGETGKLKIFDFAFALDRYTVWAGVLGGAALSLASHGTDHLMAQRYLLVPTDRDAQKVVIVSGFFVFFQFAFFLFIGSCLFSLWGGRTFDDPNDVFAVFMVEKLPPGILGIVLSGVLAAAMSTLAGSINALAASSVRDIGVGLFGMSTERAQSVALARALSLLWVVLLGAAAFLAAMAEKNAVDQALGIASITYGGILGIFLLGRFTNVPGGAALFGFLTGIGFVAFLKFSPLPGLGSIFWPWYVPAGTTITMITALLVAKLFPRTTQEPPPAP